SQGWHIQYDMISDEKHRFLRNPEELRPFDLDRVRLELMMPDKSIRDLGERLARTDVELLSARLDQRGAEQGLREYRQHATALERRRKELEEQISQLHQEGGDLKAQVINLERGLDEYRQHATALQGLRKELERQISQLQEERG